MVTVSNEIGLTQYESLGGLKDAIHSDAEEVFNRLLAAGAPQGAIKRIFQRITDTGEGEKPIRKPEKISVLVSIAGTGRETFDRIIQAFVDRGLLVVRKPEKDEPWVDLPHECLTWKWRTLHGWIDQEASLARSLEFFKESAAQKQPITGSALTQAREMRSEGRLNGPWPQRYLSENELADVKRWVQASEVKDHRERDRARRNLYIAIGLASVFAALAAFAGWETVRAWRAQNRAVSALRTAKARELTAFAAESQTEDPNRALYLAWRVTEMGVQVPPDLEAVMANALANGVSYSVLRRHKGGVASAVLSPDGSTLASGGEDGRSDFGRCRLENRFEQSQRIILL